MKSGKWRMRIERFLKNNTAMVSPNAMRVLQDQKPKITQTKEGRILAFEAELPGVVLIEILK
jgi:hypothetical protein